MKFKMWCTFIYKKVTKDSRPSVWREEEREREWGGNEKGGGGN